MTTAATAGCCSTSPAAPTSSAARWRSWTRSWRGSRASASRPAWASPTRRAPPGHWLASARRRTVVRSHAIAAHGEARTAIAGLPVETLRLAAEDAHLLRRLGLVTIGALENLPRASLTRRFPSRERGSAVLMRLDQALGQQAEPIVPMAPPPACLERPGPAGAPDRPGRGWMPCWPGSCRGSPCPWSGTGSAPAGSRSGATRVDGGVVRRAVATARATRDGDHLLHLFRETLETIEPGFGIDCAALHAERVEPLAPRAAFPHRGQAAAGRRGPAGRSPAGKARRRRRLPAGAGRPPQARGGRASGGSRPGACALARGVRSARDAATALPTVRPARAHRRDGRGAGRPAAALHLAPGAPPRRPRRRARAHRAGMVGRRRRAGRDGARLLPHRGRGRPALLALPRRPSTTRPVPAPRPAGTCTGFMDDARVPARHG